MNNLPNQCPKCGHQPDDVQGRECGHPVHLPHICAEDVRLNAIGLGASTTNASRLGIRRRRDVELYGQWAAELAQAETRDTENALRQAARFVDVVRYWLDQPSDYAGRIFQLRNALAQFDAGRPVELPEDES